MSSNISLRIPTLTFLVFYLQGMISLGIVRIENKELGNVLSHLENGELAAGDVDLAKTTRVTSAIKDLDQGLERNFDNFVIDFEPEVSDEALRTEVDHDTTSSQAPPSKDDKFIDGTLLFSFMILRALIAVRSVNSESQQLMIQAVAFASLSRAIYEGRDWLQNPASLVLSAIKEFSHVYGLCFVLRSCNAFSRGDNDDDSDDI